MGPHQIGLRDVRHGKPRSRLRLLAPLRYLAIWHPQKTVYDIYMPITIGIGVWSVQQLLFPTLPIFGDQGALKYTRDFLVMAVPFLVGALATVAMSSPAAHLDRRPDGAELVLSGSILTLRQFVCYLLGYLAFLGIVLLGASIVTPLIHDTVMSWLENHVLFRNIVKSAGILSLFLGVSAFSITILWSLFFLTDIVNRHEP